MNILLDHGANVNIKRWGGETPLTGAVVKGNVDAVRLILESAEDDVEKRSAWLLQARTFLDKYCSSSCSSSNRQMKLMLDNWS